MEYIGIEVPSDFLPWMHRTTQQSTTSANDSTATLSDTITPVETSTPGLTAFEESSNVLEVKAGAPPDVDRQISNPYPVLQPTELTERNYLVSSFTWTSILGTTVIKFPEVLKTIPTIANVLKRFRYLRASIKLEIRINATPYHQGSLMISWLPCPLYNFIPSLTEQSGCNSVVITAAQQDVVSLEIPWLNPQDYIDMTQVITAGHDTRMAMVYITQLNPLLTTNAAIAASIPVTVFASFKQTEVTGYVSQSAPFKFKEPEAVAQMSSKGFKNSEAAKKQHQGMDVKAPVSAISKVLRQAPIIGAPYGMIADFVNSIAGDLSKPNSQQAQQAVLYTLRQGGNQATSVNFADELSVYPNQLLAQSARMYGMDTSHVKVSQLAALPLLYDQVTLTNLSPTYATIASPRALGNAYGTIDWLNAVSRAFKFYRGSIKYLFHFCVPAFYSFRVRVSLNYNAPLFAVTDPGDLLSDIIDIKGDTWINYNVNYLRPITWTDLVSDTLAPKLQIDVITTIVGSSLPATPVVYLNVFRGGGEDMRFAQLGGAIGRGYVSIDEEATAQCDLRGEFKKPFKTFIQGATQSVELNNTMVDVIETVNDCLKRDSLHASNFYWSYPTDVLGTNSVPLYLTRWEPFHYFSSFFLFWRGSRKLSVVYEQNGYRLEHAFDNYSTWGDSLSHWPQTATAPYIQPSLIVPWYSGLPYTFMTKHQPTFWPPTAGFPQDVANVGNPPDPNVISAGDDYVTLHPVPFWFPAFAPERTARKNLNLSSTANTMIPDFRFNRN
jgi:hypothetical protein